MTIHLYTVCWNEIRILPYFLRYYEQFCDAIIIYDNGSDDGSMELIASHPLCKLRHVDSNGEFDEGTMLRVKGQEWKQSRGVADWVISCDIDEILHHPELPQFLEECRGAGVTVPVPSGFQMVSRRFPAHNGQISDVVSAGFRDSFFDKRIIFNPAAIREINYSPGCHWARPDGDVRERIDPALKLLHFKYLGLEYLTARYAALDRRRSQFNRQHGYGDQYSWSAVTLDAELAKYLSWAKPVDLGRRQN
jgi:hypothetical protein